MVNLKDLELKQTEDLLISMGQPAYRGRQVFHWLYRNVTDFDEMTDLPANLRLTLREETSLGLLRAETVQVSGLDGTRKYLFALDDGNAVESVFMKYKYGNSLCISSQAGCRMGCRFCASGLNGLARNLTPGEMTEQIMAAERESGEKISRVVVMGTGEPMDNFDNLASFIRIINDKEGMNLGMRNITVSTCGIVPMISRFSAEFPQVNLAVSLHGADDETRNDIMPINRAYPVSELMAACKDYTDATSRRITFEYTMVKDLNDGEKQARELADLLSGMLCHVNLIPMNRVEETGLSPSVRQRAEKFRDYLESRGIPTTIRREMGSDIDGACGQLRLKSR